MYTTVKQVHVFIEQRVQQMGSNIHLRLPPQYIDACLNKALHEVIKSKYDDYNVRQEGFEETKLRYDELQPLKRRVKLLADKEYSDDIAMNPLNSFNPAIRAFALPIDYKYMVSATCGLNKSMAISDIGFRNKVFFEIKTADELRDINGTINLSLTDTRDPSISYGSFTSTIVPQNLVINKDVMLTVLSEVTNFFNTLSEKGILIFKTPDDKTWITGDASYSSPKQITMTGSLLRNPLGTGDMIITTNESWNMPTVDIWQTPIRIVASIDMDMTYDNYFYSQTAKTNPMAILSNNYLLVRQLYPSIGTVVTIPFIELEYICEPVEFSIDTGSMPKSLPFMDDVINNTIDQLLLLLKDPSFQASAQLTQQNN